MNKTILAVVLILITGLVVGCKEDRDTANKQSEVQRQTDDAKKF
jgi:hypothetical protein